MLNATEEKGRFEMGKIIKKCLACGTLNAYDAEQCKKCESPLLADVDQDDEILGVDPMEVALSDAVSTAEGMEDDLVAQILKEQAENAKQIVAKEKEKEERKKKREAKKGSSYGFSIGGESSGSYGSSGSTERSGGYGSFGRTDGSPSRFSGFKISSGDGYVASDEDEPGRVHFNGSLRMQAIRKSQAQGKTDNDEK